MIRYPSKLYSSVKSRVGQCKSEYRFSSKQFESGYLYYLAQGDAPIDTNELKI